MDSIITGLLFCFGAALPCYLLEVGDLLDDLPSSAENPGPDGADRDPERLGNLRIGETVDGEEEQCFPVPLAETPQCPVDDRARRLGVDPVQDRCREIVIDPRLLTQVRATAALHPTQVVTDHIDADAVEPGETAGTFEAVSVPGPHRGEEDVGGHIGSVSRSHPSAGEAEDGVVMPRRRSPRTGTGRRARLR